MLVNRDNYISVIRPFYDVDIIKVIMGSRRAGKSKIVELIIQDLKNQGIQNDDILYINFEDLTYDDINDYRKLNTYVKEHIGTNKQYLFFDEIHHVKGFEKAINSFRVSFDCSIFITGSNSKLLSSEISSLLTGRTIQFTIYPFTYSEALAYRTMNNTLIEDPFYEFLQLGGYPLRFSLPDEQSIKLYLNELFDDICKKDIFTRDNTIEIEKFNKICQYLMIQASNEFNAENVYNFLKSENKGKEYCSLGTIYNYLEKLEKAFIIKRIYKYDISGMKALKYNPKIYAIDNGFRFIKLNGNGIDIGRFLENLVCIELLSRGYEVYVGKTYKGEVDFVVIKNGKKCFIQVAYVMLDETTVQREFSAFSPIKDSSPKYVMSLDKVDLSRNGITHLNIIDFLTGKVDLYLS